MGRFAEAGKDFERAIKSDRQFADAYNNRGVIYYLEKKYGKAIKQYESAIKLRQDSGSFYSNLGAAYFSKKDFEKASLAYNQALQIDPEIFDRTSHNGVQAQMSSPARPRALLLRAGQDLRQSRRPRPLAAIFASGHGRGVQGDRDVYKDSEFAGLRKDPRFTELMSARPVAIPRVKFHYKYLQNTTQLSTMCGFTLQQYS